MRLITSENFEELEKQGAAEFAAESLAGIPERTLDLRYRLQGYELNVDVQSACARAIDRDVSSQLHERYGFCDAARPIEIVNLRLRMIAAGEPYTPAHTTCCGRRSAACFAERDSLLRWSFRTLRVLPPRSARSRRHNPRPGNDHRIHLRHGAAARLARKLDGFGNLMSRSAGECA